MKKKKAENICSAFIRLTYTVINKRGVHRRFYQDYRDFISVNCTFRENSEESPAFVQEPAGFISSLRITRRVEFKNNSRTQNMPSDTVGNNRKKKIVTERKSLPPLMSPSPTSPIHRMSKLFTSLFAKERKVDLRRKWSATYNKMIELSKVLEENEELPGARVFSTRVYDLVMDNAKNTSANHVQVDMPPFLKKVFDLVSSFKGGSSSRILSPRIAPVVPQIRPRKGVLSPSVFPFYNDEREEQILPIPKVLRNLDSFALGKKLLSATERIGERFEKLRNSLSNVQKKEMDKRGFTFLEPTQMKKLYKMREDISFFVDLSNNLGTHHTHQSASTRSCNPPELPIDLERLKVPEVGAMLDEYDALPKEHREETLWEAIAKIAGKTHRRKRQISVLTPSILSPVLFSPVFGASILGPVALSPSVFSPVILAPSVLSPVMLSPSVGVPVILSPSVLSPSVLNPGFLNVAVLSPSALAPSVLSPEVASLSILSPFVLSPSILSPAALAGSVLSPGALSPNILGRGFLIATVLSPSFLSCQPMPVKEIGKHTFQAKKMFRNYRFFSKFLFNK
ncbi:unnamed protein product [Angiostrongylus costaricensis]|uniref:Uncharacterized protein n=1 Tax=Angiostrongylus costaricensis TaxID=334426 RepID=A0A0R3Q190_ANGCS|nr:unnamed protein product [Angiostrongylus costaricensis]